MRVRFERRVIDFLAAMRGQTMHDQRVRLRQFHEILVDPIRSELRFAPGFFAFLAHGDPDVGVKHVGAPGGFLQVRIADDIAADALQPFRARLVLLWRRQTQLEVQLRRREHPGARRVRRAVADERDDLALNAPAFFLERENVRQDLAGMLFVSQRIDRRQAGELGELLDVRLGESADDRAVDHAGQDPRRVLDELAAPELNIVRVQENRFASQLAHTDFERDACPGGRLGKNEAPGLAAQRKLRVLAAVLFLQSSNAEDVFHLRPAQLLDAEKILHGAAANSATTASIARKPSIASGRVRFSAGKSRMTAVPAGTVRTPAACSRSTT